MLCKEHESLHGHDMMDTYMRYRLRQSPATPALEGQRVTPAPHEPANIRGKTLHARAIYIHAGLTQDNTLRVIRGKHRSFKGGNVSSSACNPKPRPHPTTRGRSPSANRHGMTMKIEVQLTRGGGGVHEPHVLKPERTLAVFLKRAKSKCRHIKMSTH